MTESTATQRGRRLLNIRMSAVFLLSIITISFQLGVMKTFSVGSWSTFGSMVISIALLGNGLAGTLLTFLNKKVRAHAEVWLRWSALALIPAMVLSHVTAQFIPFKPVLIASDTAQIWWIAAYYLVYAVPFFIGALFISVAFISFSEHIHKLYFWNMVGSGTGGFFILIMMYFFPPRLLLLPQLILAGAGAYLCFYRQEGTQVGVPRRSVLTVVSVVLLSLGVLLQWGDINVSEYKPISYARQFPDAEEVHHSFGPSGEYHVYNSSYFHFAPGLSDNASLNLTEMPDKAFMGMYVNGSGPVGIMRDLEGEKERYMKFLPNSAPYKLKENPDVLLLKLGGGVGVFTALYHDAAAVKVVEPQQKIIQLLKHDPAFRDFNGDVLRDPRVRVEKDEPRAYCRSSQENYDIIEMSLIDSVGLSSTGGYPIDENYLYTADGIADYLGRLKEDGLLSVTVWNRLTPPRNVPRLLSTVAKGLEKAGVPNPEKRVFVFSMLYSTATVLVKNSDFTAEEIKTLKKFARRMSFDVSYYPGIAPLERDYDALMQAYRDQYDASKMAEAGPLENQVPLIPAELYQFAMEKMLAGNGDEFFRDYLFDVRPATDSRPYYTGYLTPETVRLLGREIAQLPEEWGYVMTLGTFGMSLLFGLLIILIPLVGRWRELFSRRKGTLGVVLYFAALGLGFMFVEIYLISKFVFFLSEPIYSTSIVITVMLISSGLGSLYSSRFHGSAAQKIRRASYLAAAGMLFYLFLLNPILMNLLGLPFLVKVLLTILFVAPVAFVLGMFFPTGLNAVSENRPGLIPWAWGLNGALSVTGTVLADLLSLSFGFPAVLLTVTALYLAAGFLFPATQKR